jgi:hypothetical protein
LVPETKFLSEVFFIDIGVKIIKSFIDFLHEISHENYFDIFEKEIYNEDLVSGVKNIERKNSLPQNF